MRNKLAIFSEAAAKEDECFAELLLLRRVPAAYRQCLAECMRRCVHISIRKPFCYGLAALEDMKERGVI